MLHLLILAIRAYQHTVGLVLPNACRFTPTCSEYTIEALKRFGILRGGLMSVYRILRCNPFCAGGYDPVTGAKRDRL
ncbi:MAG: membrane protein insertion efficiency factor YidD [candidate division WOR-3 bacterium]